MSKIASDHLAREAVVYIRQSTPDQLRNNHETRYSIESSTTLIASTSRAKPSASATGRRRSTAATTSEGGPAWRRGPWAPAAPSPVATPGRAAAC